MENILKVFLMAFPEWLACIFMVVGLVVTALYSNQGHLQREHHQRHKEEH